MPHDNRGTELHVGDTVMVPCVVKAIHLIEDYCNVDLQTKLTMPPSNTVQAMTLNSRQTIKPTATHRFPAIEAAVGRQWKDLAASLDIEKRKAIDVQHQCFAEKEAAEEKLAEAEARIAELEAERDTRTCTCHPDDNPPKPCAEQYALSECQAVERRRREP